MATRLLQKITTREHDPIDFERAFKDPINSTYIDSDSIYGVQFILSLSDLDMPHTFLAICSVLYEVSKVAFFSTVLLSAVVSTVYEPHIENDLLTNNDQQKLLKASGNPVFGVQSDYTNAIHTTNAINTTNITDAINTTNITNATNATDGTTATDATNAIIHAISCDKSSMQPTYSSTYGVFVLICLAMFVLVKTGLELIGRQVSMNDVLSYLSTRAQKMNGLACCVILVGLYCTLTFDGNSTLNYVARWYIGYAVAMLFLLRQYEHHRVLIAYCSPVGFMLMFSMSVLLTAFFVALRDPVVILLVMLSKLMLIGIMGQLATVLWRLNAKRRTTVRVSH